MISVLYLFQPCSPHRARPVPTTVETLYPPSNILAISSDTGILSGYGRSLTFRRGGDLGPRGGFEMSRNETRLLRPCKLRERKCMERSGPFKGNFILDQYRHRRTTIRMVRPP